MWLVDLHSNFQCDWPIELSYNKIFQTNHNWGNCDFYDYVKKTKKTHVTKVPIITQNC